MGQVYKGVTHGYVHAIPLHVQLKPLHLHLRMHAPGYGAQWCDLGRPKTFQGPRGIDVETPSIRRSLSEQEIRTPYTSSAHQGSESNQLTKGADITHSFTCPHDDMQKVLSGQAVLKARHEQPNIRT